MASRRKSPFPLSQGRAASSAPPAAPGALTCRWTGADIALRGWGDDRAKGGSRRSLSRTLFEDERTHHGTAGRVKMTQCRIVADMTRAVSSGGCDFPRPARRVATNVTAPAVAALSKEIASRFGSIVYEKIAASAVPIASAAAINVAFMNYFQKIARGHFILRRLERIYGAERVRAGLRG